MNSGAIGTGLLTPLVRLLSETRVDETVVLFICFILSIFFSGTESALFSLTSVELHQCAQSQGWRERAVHRMMREPQKILITLLLGNLFVNLALSMLATSILLRTWSEWGHLISIAIVTPLVIVLCEITPKIVAINLHRKVSKIAVVPLLMFHVLLFPMRIAILFLTDLFIRTFKLRLDRRSITKDELHVAVKKSEEMGVIEPHEKVFISNVLRFTGKDASNVMFPRSSAVFLPWDASVKEAMRIVSEAGVIRAPVYRDDLDHIIGMIDSRDLLPAYFGYRRSKTIKPYIREISFFPASREVADLLNDFLTQGIQIAVVLDEYGGTAGVVTLNKLLSEILGRDMMRWEDTGRQEIRKAGDGITIISGEMQIEDFNHLFGCRLESREIDSVGGYMIEALARMPRRGDAIETESFMLRVRHVKKNKIESIEVIRRSPETGDAQ